MQRAFLDTALTMPADAPLPHPFDPLSKEEIETAISVVKKAHGDDLLFNVVSLQEPRKAEMTAWLENPTSAARPVRIADAVVIASDGKVYDGLVDLQKGSIVSWEVLDGLQPIVSYCMNHDGVHFQHHPQNPINMPARARSLWRSSS